MADYNELNIGGLTGSVIQTPVSLEGSRRTYYASSTFACDATATDIAVFQGAANVTAKIQWINIESTATAAATGDLKIIRRTAANTAGTSANASLGQCDNVNDVTPACIPIHYTAHPTALGAAATNPSLGAYRFNQVAVAGTLPVTGRMIDFAFIYGGRLCKVMGAADFICINVPAALGGAANAWDITWCWTEQAGGTF